MAPYHSEQHRSRHIGWLRAAVLGANDGAISTASLVVGVAAAHTTRQGILIAGLAGITAGAMAMAAGEYVSVSSQADTEKADLARETRELADDMEGERKELAGIYAARGLTPELATEVATQLMAHDALGAHAREELGITESQSARPVQAAAASAVTFVTGAVIPLVLAAMVPREHTILAVVLATLCPHNPRSTRGQSRRRADASRHAARDLLGRASNGRYGGCWRALSHRCVTRHRFGRRAAKKRE